jgi:adenylate kinase
MHVILMGAQGSGKGTQAERIAPRFNLAHLSTGDVFRAAIANGTELGLLAQQYLDKGELVPDAITIGIVDAKLLEIAASTPSRDGALFDGFPRTAGQAAGLDSALAKRDELITAVVEIFVPREKLVMRLLGRRVCQNCGATFNVVMNPPKIDGICDRCGHALLQRKDDTPEAIERRLDIFFAETQPLFNYYQERGLLTRVNGDRPIEQVTAEISDAITSAADR